VVEVMQTLRARILERLADSAELDFFSGDHTYLGKLVIPLKVDAQQLKALLPNAPTTTLQKTVPNQ
jgi:hypothetical protein